MKNKIITALASYLRTGKSKSILAPKRVFSEKKITSKAIFGCVAKDHSRAIFLKEYGSLSWVLLGYQVVYINFLISKTWN